MQVSNSKQQHYMRAKLTKAGDYSLAVSVVDPVVQEPLRIRPHGDSERLRIVPGSLDPARTRITGLPATLTAGAHSGASHPLLLEAQCAPCCI